MKFLLEEYICFNARSKIRKQPFKKPTALPVVYREKEYESQREFCHQQKISQSVFNSKILQGYSVEQAVSYCKKRKNRCLKSNY